MFDGPINGTLLLAWVETRLVPTLAAGDVVIMDNLGSHKGKAVRAAIRAAGAHLFLPPHSADLNPTEQVFAKLKQVFAKLKQVFAKPKHLLRAAQERPREATWRRIGALLERLTATECANYIIRSGYASTPA